MSNYKKLSVQPALTGLLQNKFVLQRSLSGSAAHAGLLRPLQGQLGCCGVSVSDSLQVVREHPGLVCVPTALVGPQDTGLLHLPRGGKSRSCWHTV